MDEALALLEKYEPKRKPCPPELAPLLKALSDYAQRGRPLKREALVAEVKSKGYNVGRKVIADWIQDAGGTPWFGTS